MTFVSTASKSGGGMVKLASTVLTGTAATFDFQNISQSYRHLRLYLMGRSDNAGTTLSGTLVVNNDTASHYTSQAIVNSNSATVIGQEQIGAVTSLVLFRIAGAGATAGEVGTHVLDFPEYANTTFFKTITSLGMDEWGNASSARTLGAYVGVWRSTAAISGLTLGPGGGNWIAGSAATLYGIV